MKTRQWKFNYEEGAEYVSCPLDGKNMTTDWLEEFFFDGNCSISHINSRIAGYGRIGDFEQLCECTYYQDYVTWTFVHLNYLEVDDIEAFAKSISDYLGDTPRFAFRVRAVEHGELKGCYTNEIIVRFEHKAE